MPRNVNITADQSRVAAFTLHPDNPLLTNTPRRYTLYTGGSRNTVFSFFSPSKTAVSAAAVSADNPSFLQPFKKVLIRHDDNAVIKLFEKFVISALCMAAARRKFSQAETELSESHQGLPVLISGGTL